MDAIVIADRPSRVGKMGELFRDLDLLISLGDMDNQYIERAIKLYKPALTIAVSGNHDSKMGLPSGVVSLNMETTIIDGVTFGGFPGCVKYKDSGAWLFEQRECAKLMRDMPPVDIFISHNSPYGVHDGEDLAHEGFRAFNEYIDIASPKYFFHGHQHDRCVTMVKNTVVRCFYGEESISIDL